MRRAVFPGSFDPITNGHLDIIHRALPLFDEIIIAIGTNSSKKYMFPLEKRIEWLEETFKEHSKIKITHYENMLTVDYCKQVDAKFIIRGLRNPADFEFEKAIAQTNRKLDPEIETVFLLTSSGFSSISSSIVREVMQYDGDYSSLVPDTVKK
ncbi:MAG: pantetheine-phosphate adenylyltransferase [Bacteroidota bacterium]